MTSRIRGILMVSIGLLLLVAWAGVARGTQESQPAGNNGTVKVEGEDFDNLHDNDPHVGCSFQIQWYGFDEGTRTTTVTFEAQPPTGNGDLLLGDTFSFQGSGSGNELDAEKAYDLTSALANFTPQPQQGFHVKLTINTDGSQGADVKHKVFWVDGCTPPETTTTVASTTVPSTTIPGTTVPTTIPGTTIPGAPTTLPGAPTTAPANVEGSSIVRAPANATATGAEPLAKTGINSALWAFGGAALIGVGVTLVAKSRIKNG